MTDAIALLWPPFLVALCLIGIHTYFGIQVLARNVIFVDLARSGGQVQRGLVRAFPGAHEAPSPRYGLQLHHALRADRRSTAARNVAELYGSLRERAAQGRRIGGDMNVVTATKGSNAVTIVDNVPHNSQGAREIGFSVPDRYNASDILFDNLDAGRCDRPAVIGVFGEPKGPSKFPPTVRPRIRSRLDMQERTSRQTCRVFAWP